MQRLVQQIRHLVYRQETSAPDMLLNRIAQGGSHDRALAAFKADQIRIARRARRTGEVQDSARA
jgi:hypothetical protein